MVFSIVERQQFSERLPDVVSYLACSLPTNFYSHSDRYFGDKFFQSAFVISSPQNFKESRFHHKYRRRRHKFSFRLPHHCEALLTIFAGAKIVTNGNAWSRRCSSVLA